MKFFLTFCITLLLASFQMSAQIFGVSTYYTVAHNNGNSNVLFELNSQTNQWAKVGLTGTNNIKAITTDPVNKIIYAVDQGTFGTINAETGLFTGIDVIGQANGAIGAVNLNNIEGLTFDNINNVIYATHRIASGTPCNPTSNSNDLLFKINISTGKYVANAMLNANGGSADYALIEEVAISNALNGCNTNGILYDVNDIAYNAYTGELFAIQNQGSFSVISILNPANATSQAVIYNLDYADFVGLTFSNLGELYGTTGNNAADQPLNCFKFVDLQNMQTTNLSFPDPSSNSFDFRSLDYFISYNDLALKLTVDPNITNPVEPGDEVTFFATVYNQGKLANNGVIISNYIPNGLILNDPMWVLLPGTNVAEYFLAAQLDPATNVSIPISFTVSTNFDGTEIINCAEITTSFNKNITSIGGGFLPLIDIDSEPDDINNEVIDEDPLVDNEINQGGPNLNEDEDDHDIASINIFNLTNNLSLSRTIKPATCTSTGAAEIKILGNCLAPFTHQWSNQFGTVIYSDSNNNLTHTITGLPAGTYNATVYDANNKTSLFVVTIPMYAANSGNLSCGNNCPDYLVTSNDFLNGNFQAKEVITINGSVDGSQDAEFSICD